MNESNHIDIIRKNKITQMQFLLFSILFVILVCMIFYISTRDFNFQSVLILLAFTLYPITLNIRLFKKNKLQTVVSFINDLIIISDYDNGFYIVNKNEILKINNNNKSIWKISLNNGKIIDIYTGSFDSSSYISFENTMYSLFDNKISLNLESSILRRHKK